MVKVMLVIRRNLSPYCFDAPERDRSLMIAFAIHKQHVLWPQVVQDNSPNLSLCAFFVAHSSGTCIDGTAQ